MQGEGASEELPECSIDDVSASWGRIARNWSAFVRGGHDIHRERLHGPALLDACGDVRGCRVLDIGCGEGWCSRALASRGAAVTAIDLCHAMIAEALTHPEQIDQLIDYRVMDAVDVDHHAWPEKFHLVTACMSLHNMPDPGAALRAVRRVLAPAGRLVCSIPHPMTHMRGGRHGVHHHNDDTLYIRAGDYFRSAPYLVWWNFGADAPWPTIRWSRPGSEYAAMLKEAGFVVSEFGEPAASHADMEQHERLRNAGQLPYYLILVAEPARRQPPLA